MRLSGSLVKEIREALMRAFPTPEKLRIMLREELDILPSDVPNSADYNEIISKLIEKFESENRIEELIEGACRANPGNEKLKTLKKWLYQSFSDCIGASAKDDNFIEKHWKSLYRIIHEIELKLLAQVCRATLENNSKIQDVSGNYPELIELEDLDTLKTILLEKCPDNDKGVPTIIEFAERLANRVEVKETENQLNTWVKTVAKELKINLPTYDAGTKSSGTAESYLLITVKPKGSEKFYIEAELIFDYNDIKKKPIKLALEQEQGEVECYFNEIINKIYDFIQLSKVEYLHQDHVLTIELFLPLQYLGKSIDIEEIPIGLGNRRKPIGNEYRLAIRSIERITSNAGEYLNRLSQRWKCLTNLQPIPKKYLDCLTQIDNCNWDELATNWELEERLGLKINCCLPDSDEDKEELFVAILRGGIPAALWTRSSNLSPEDQEQFNQLLTLECLQNLSQLFESVWKQRKLAHAKKEKAKDYLGYHLGLLCDHPHRIPYHLKPKSRKLRETGT